MRTAIVLLIILSSCSTTKNRVTTPVSNLFKKYAYCKCLEQSIDTFSIRDSLEMGSGEVANSLDYNGIFTNIIDPIFDTLILNVIEEQKRIKQDTAGKHDSSWGKTNYILKCLEFYESKKLDSTIRTFTPEMYLVKKSL